MPLKYYNSKDFQSPVTLNEITCFYKHIIIQGRSKFKELVFLGLWKQLICSILSGDIFCENLAHY